MFAYGKAYLRIFVYTNNMSLSLLITGVLVLGVIIYIVQRIAKARGMSRATKILLPVSIVISLFGIGLLFAGYIEIGSALIGLAGAMTLLEGYLRHKAERSASISDSQGSSSS